MRFYFRTGKSSGVGVGPIGALFLGMLYLAVLMIGVALAVIYLLVYLLVLGVRAARRRGSAESLEAKR